MTRVARRRTKTAHGSTGRPADIEFGTRLGKSSGKVRCAIYTRKSSEEGLEQDFNSLHAQREACAAYVLSQASEGWTLLPDEYDDGGLSGGTLERPALQAPARRHCCRQDRHRRGLQGRPADPLAARLCQAGRGLRCSGTSFVSVTQSFNTTTSMGRLTLNMLLSFAQFEREVTAERIRDKIAASKARGMWMGGNPPLGYGPKAEASQSCPSMPN
jgi:site-specific DNA recombinase